MAKECSEILTLLIFFVRRENAKRGGSNIVFKVYMFTLHNFKRRFLKFNS